jgi:membrane protein implicated in regulation of membrane protease activity
MNWEAFYLICFVVGLVVSLVSLLGGLGHFGGHVHMPHAPHLGGTHLPHGIAGARAGANTGTGGAAVPWWNFFSITVFLCWFGAAGYLFTRHGSFVAGFVLLLAALCGLAGGALVFLFLTRVLLPHERELTADETEVVGAVGRVSAPIRAGGIGEMVYEQLGARRSVPARSEGGEPIPKQEEVFVVRYEKGIAYVRRWQEGLESVETGNRAGGAQQLTTNPTADPTSDH